MSLNLPQKTPPTITIPESELEESVETSSVFIELAPSLFVAQPKSGGSLTEALSVGITHILTVSKRSLDPRLLSKNLTCCVLPLACNSSVNISAYLLEAVDFIRNGLHRGGRVLVHSSHGISRAPAIVCAYFVLEEGLSASQAIERVKASHPTVDMSFELLLSLYSLQGAS